MKKRLFAAAVILSAALTFSGCFPTGEKQQSEGVTVEYKSGDNFKYSKDNLTVEFTIPETLPQATRIGIKPKAIDREKVIKLFFGERAYTQGLESEGRLNFYETDDGVFSLNFNGGRIRFSDNRVCGISVSDGEYPIDYGRIVPYCEPRFWNFNAPSDNELVDFPRETALHRAEDLLTQLGIENLTEPEVYPMSVDAIKKIAEEMSNPVIYNQDLSPEHECYILRYSQGYDGFELADLPIDIGRNHYNTTKIVLVVTREEIVYFIAECPFEADFEVLSQEPVKYDFDYALSEFKSFHDAAYFGEETTIYSSKPVYYPEGINESGAVEFVPMWIFEGLSLDAEDGLTRGTRYVAAIGSDNGILRQYKE